MRHLLAVQAQDAPLARASVALRCAGVADDVRAALDAGVLVRTHVLRPTWHLVAAEDVRWLLGLSAPRIASSLGGRHRQLGLDEATRGAARASFERALAAGPATRPALQGALLADGVLAAGPLLGQQVAHLLLLAELEALAVSGPVVGPGAGVHTYALAEGRLPATAPRERAEAVGELVRRFVASHGPVSLPDLQRWVRLTLAEIRTALRATPTLASTGVDGVELWYDTDAADAAAPHLAAARDASLLLPVFDEAFLSYHDVEFPRRDGHPMGSDAHRFAETGGGVAVSRLVDVGTWKRTRSVPTCDLTLALASGATASEVAGVVQAAARLASVVAPDAPARLSRR